MGGTFDPIHLGHLRGAEEVRESFELDEVIFIPAAIPPHKKREGITDSSQRLEMVQRAVQTNPFFSVSDIELRRTGKSYSVDTLRHFKALHQGPLFFILGRDAFAEIETWKDFETLFTLCHFIVMTRPVSQRKKEGFSLPDGLVSSFRYDPLFRAWIHRSGNRVFLSEISLLDISSTQIRERIKKGGSTRYLLPEGVEAYIREKGLYRKEK